MGRPRNKGKREPNGKLSRKAEHVQERRTIDEEAAMSVAKDARIRVHDVSSENAGTELAGSVIGRLYLRGEINSDQLRAAMIFSQAYADYQRAVDSPRPPKAVNIDGASGSTPVDMDAKRANRARSEWGSMIGILQLANNAHRHAAVYAACDYIVLRDTDLPHLLPSMRLGLNAIARAYGLAERAA